MGSRAYTSRDLDRLAGELSPRWRAVFHFLWATGARCGEALALTPDCVEARAPGVVAIHIRPHELPNGRLWRPKRPASVRTIICPDGALPPDWGAGPYVFPGARTVDAACKALKRACARADVPYNGTHGFRRGRIVQALAAGADPNTVATAVGHASLLTTLTYVHAGGLEAALPDPDAPAQANPPAAEWLKAARPKKWSPR